MNGLHRYMTYGVDIHENSVAYPSVYQRCVAKHDFITEVSIGRNFALGNIEFCMTIVEWSL